MQILLKKSALQLWVGIPIFNFGADILVIKILHEKMKTRKSALKLKIWIPTQSWYADFSIIILNISLLTIF